MVNAETAQVGREEFSSDTCPIIIGEICRRTGISCNDYGQFRECNEFSKEIIAAVAEVTGYLYPDIRNGRRGRR